MGKRIVAVVVGVLVAGALGVGGVMVASRSGQRTPATLPALQVAGDQAAAGTSAQSAQAAVGRGDSDGNAQSRVVPSGRVQYQVRGTLPDLPRSAMAWTLPDQVTKARVAELAAALGLVGEPRQSAQTWTVTDGTRQLFVNQLPGGPWTFSAGRFVCGGPVVGAGPKGGISPRVSGCPVAVPDLGHIPPFQQAPAASATNPSPPLPRPRPLDLPDRAGAERIARDLLTRVAAPMGGTEVQLVQSFDRWSVSAFPRIGGQPTAGFIWTAGVGSKGEILSATGWLDTPRPGDTYPLISVQEALQRLRNRQVVGPITESGPAAPALPCARTDQPQPPGGGCGPAKPLTLEVTGVRLGLQFATALAQPNGSAQQRTSYLVPAYFFQINGSWEQQASVIAVQDRFLATTPPPTAVPLRPGG